MNMTATEILRRRQEINKYLAGEKSEYDLIGTQKLVAIDPAVPSGDRAVFFAVYPLSPELHKSRRKKVKSVVVNPKQLPEAKND